MVFAMWSLMRSPFSTNARTQDSISPRCPAGRSSNLYLPLLLYENRSATRFIGDSSHVPTPFPMKYFSISSYLIFLCLPTSISPQTTRISVGAGKKYTPDATAADSTRMRRTRFTPGRFKMLTLLAPSDTGNARHIRCESAGVVADPSPAGRSILDFAHRSKAWWSGSQAAGIDRV